MSRRKITDYSGMDGRDGTTAPAELHVELLSALPPMTKLPSVTAPPILVEPPGCNSTAESSNILAAELLIELSSMPPRGIELQLSKTKVKLDQKALNGGETESHSVKMVHARISKATM
jgi:hypothetical protein